MCLVIFSPISEFYIILCLIYTYLFYTCFKILLSCKHYIICATMWYYLSRSDLYFVGALFFLPVLSLIFLSQAVLRVVWSLGNLTRPPCFVLSALNCRPLFSDPYHYVDVWARLPEEELKLPMCLFWWIDHDILQNKFPFAFFCHFYRKAETNFLGRRRMKRIMKCWEPDSNSHFP